MPNVQSYAPVLLVRSGVRTLYNILFRMVLLLALPLLALRVRGRVDGREALSQRLGQYDRKLKQALTNRQVLWLHVPGSSAVNLCTQFIRALELRLPNLKLVVSTSTETGMEALQRHVPAQISKIYFPLDRRAYVSRAMSLLNPEAVVLLEAELWPNFMWRARARHIPVFLVSTRLADRRYRRYRRFGLLFRPLFGGVAGVAVQTEAEAARLRALGCRADRVQVVGALPLEAARLEERRPLGVQGLLEQLGVKPGVRLLLGSGTYPGEEDLLAEQFLRLRERFPDLFLVLAPRQLERCKEAGAGLASRGLRFVYRNEVTAHTQFRPGKLDCLLVNTPGDARYFAERATVIFLGRSLTAQGGQDPVDYATLGKPLIFGPHMEEHAEAARGFLEKGGAIQVRSAQDLEQALGELLNDDSRREQMARAALAAGRRHSGAVDHTVEMILQQLDQDELYVVPN